MYVGDYLAGVEQTLQHCPGITGLRVLASQASGPYNGLLRVRAAFWDESFLDIYEVVNTELGYPIRIHYAYTYLDRDGQHVFRYDNAPHHPELLTHPHHRHGGPSERAVPAEQPSLNQVLAEITRLLAGEPNH